MNKGSLNLKKRFNSVSFFPEESTSSQIKDHESSSKNQHSKEIRRKMTENVNEICHDSRLSIANYCENCKKHQVAIDSLQKKKARMTQKYTSTQNHLKQYESLLEIKDSRLIQEKETLKVEIENLKIEKLKVSLEKTQIEEEKTRLEEEKRLFRSQVHCFILELKKMTKGKYRELTNQEETLKFQSSPDRNLLTLDSEVLNPGKITGDELQMLMNEIYENLLDSKNSSDKKEDSSEILMVRNRKTGKKQQSSIDEQIKKISEYQKKEEIKKLEQEKFTIQGDQKNNETAKIDLKISQEKLEQVTREKPKDCEACQNLKKQTQALQKTLENTLEKLETSESKALSLQNSTEVLENRLKIVELNRDELETEISDLTQTLSSLSSKKKLYKTRFNETQKFLFLDPSSSMQELSAKSKEIQTLNEKISDLTSQNSALSQKLQILTLKSEESCEGSHLATLYTELQAKLSQLKEKETDLQSAEQQLAKERLSLESAAAVLKQINDDISAQRFFLSSEKEKNEAQLLKIIEFDKKQQEKGRLLISKEKELDLLKESLVQRESLIAKIAQSSN